MTMEATISRSTDSATAQERYSKLSEMIIENIDKFLDYFGVDGLRKSSRRYDGPCPVHGGDKSSAFNLYHSGMTMSGNWYCNTMLCHKTFVSSPIGLVRGLLSRQKYEWAAPGDKVAPYLETIRLCESLLGISSENIEVDMSDVEKKKFSAGVSILAYERPGIENKITRDMVKRHLKPPRYLIEKKKYSKEVLAAYDVGFCDNPKKPMYMREVAPIYDDTNTYMIGCTGRTINERCPHCECYHKAGAVCPEPKLRGIYSKWKHSDGFNGEQYLYNYWFAKDYIKKWGTAIIVESPGNVWRLEEAGIHNAVGLFGDSMSDIQQSLLSSAGAYCLLLIMDNDKAGEAARKVVGEQCKRQFNIEHIFIRDYNDLGEMGADHVRGLILPVLERIRVF